MGNLLESSVNDYNDSGYWCINMEFNPSEFIDIEQEMTIKELFWRVRVENEIDSSSNHYVEICYGMNGLIDFLDLLFPQILTKP